MTTDPDTCPRCGDPTDPAWYCSEGYCPACCIATDEGVDDLFEDCGCPKGEPHTCIDDETDCWDD